MQPSGVQWWRASSVSSAGQSYAACSCSSPVSTTVATLRSTRPFNQGVSCNQQHAQCQCIEAIVQLIEHIALHCLLLVFTVYLLHLTAVEVGQSLRPVIPTSHQLPTSATMYKLLLLCITLLCILCTTVHSSNIIDSREQLLQAMQRATYNMEHSQQRSAVADYNSCRDITDEVECNSSKVESFQCVYCKAKAVKSVCVTTAQAKKLPAGVFECDSVPSVGDVAAVA